MLFPRTVCFNEEITQSSESKWCQTMQQTARNTLPVDDAGGTRLWVRRSKDWRLRMLLRCGYKATLFNLAWCSSLPLTESLSSIKFIPQFLFLWANSLFRFLQDRMVRYSYLFSVKFFSLENLLEWQVYFANKPQRCNGLVYIHISLITTHWRFYHQRNKICPNNN